MAISGQVEQEVPWSRKGLEVGVRQLHPVVIVVVVWATSLACDPLAGNREVGLSVPGGWIRLVGWWLRVT